MDAKTTIETVLNETRSFPPPKDFAQQAHLGSVAEYEKLWQESQRNPVQYWETTAKKYVSWETPWQQAFEWKEPFSKWFIGGKTNAAYNCLDRHLEKNGDKLALVFEAEDGRVENWTYKQLHREVCRFSNSDRAAPLIANQERSYRTAPRLRDGRMRVRPG
mgnify:CR=1 FL=1